MDEKGEVIGKHYKGPVWEAADGSKVGGQVQQRANAPNANAVPWLLLKATSNQGTGTFARVTYIQRVDTEGGWLRRGLRQIPCGRGSVRPITRPLTSFTSRDPMRRGCLASLSETPLQSLPYSPSLDLTDMDRPSIPARTSIVIPAAAG
jgi:hypothetical protein